MLTVGQKLWFVRSGRNGRSGDGMEVIVEKVGRKWAEISAGAPRIDIESLVADGGQYTSPGRCYLSEVAYDEIVSLTKAWRDFAQRIGNMQYGSAPVGVTHEAIARAADALGFSERK